jgi:hypothetical protein
VAGSGTARAGFSPIPAEVIRDVLLVDVGRETRAPASP